MASSEQQPIPLSEIHVYLKDNPRIIFGGEDGTSLQLNLTPHLLVGQLLKLLPEAQQAAEGMMQATEKNPTVTLTGRLKTQPKEGRPDAKGRPTTVARFAAHQEGEAEAHMYFATFHRHTARIALGLAKESLITVQGYPRSTDNPNHSDNLSVVNLLNYPGKSEGKTL